VFVKPETVVRWHRAGFRLYWNWRSRGGRRGRPRAAAEVRALVRRLATENPTWGAPRVHGELRMLGVEVSERTVSRLMPRRAPKPEVVQRWMAFLRNHRDAIAAMDFFVVPTVTFRVLYVWFVIEHGRRRIVHFHVTDQPDAAWVVQQLREAFPFDTAPRHLVFDRDGTFSAHVVSTVKSFGTKPTRTSPRSPWQNGVAERWIGSVRRELLDHVVVFDDLSFATTPSAPCNRRSGCSTMAGSAQNPEGSRRSSSAIERVMKPRALSSRSVTGEVDGRVGDTKAGRGAWSMRWHAIRNGGGGRRVGAGR
jgi:transposase InsO family protein